MMKDELPSGKAKLVAWGMAFEFEKLFFCPINIELENVCSTLRHLQEEKVKINLPLKATRLSSSLAHT
ncbi:hypothetical protein CEXT_522471 [Caerostris extrusa]|uniref:Uncharacterized protein n=1 Tax=Caerostris extrusa TaxID=172846 RepID=A0AAV4Q523_CAEEX|nr:hypothetical protein CEXT_522471 [Caerostris extrusa]